MTTCRRIPTGFRQRHAATSFFSTLLLTLIGGLCACSVRDLTAAEPAEATNLVFESIFDGKTLNGWDGDPTYWHVEDGQLVGTVTRKTLLKRNSWILWRGGVVRDFELKLEYWISDKGNSGVGYRCLELDGQPYAVRGYQADIDGGDNWTGNNYEERGRAFLAARGQRTIVEPGERPRVVEQFAGPTEIQAKVRKQDWNEYHLVVRGDRLQHYLNGVLVNEVIDHDTKNGTRAGLLGVQVHVGPPMVVKYRNIRLAEIPTTEPANVKTSLTPQEYAKLLTFDNPSGISDMVRQISRLTAPPQREPVGGLTDVTVKALPYFVAHGLQGATLEATAKHSEPGTDLVLIRGSYTVRTAKIPEKIAALQPDKRYRFSIHWDDDVDIYRVVKVQDGDRTVYESSD